MVGLLALLVSFSAIASSAAEASPSRRALTVHQTETPVFPYRLRELGLQEGDARVLIEVDETGKLVDWLVIAYSHRLFAESAVQALKKWTFEPAMIDGQPVTTQIEVKFYYQENGIGFVTVDMETHLQARFNQVEDYRPCTLRELDRIPTPVATAAPFYSPAMAAKGARGAVRVEFYIDENGAVKMPSVPQTEFPELAAAAVNAVRQWRFEPPTRHGRPVLVKARQVFNFAPDGKTAP